MRAARTATPVSAAAPQPPTSASLDDPAGDLTSLEGAAVAGPAHLDALRVEASVDGETLFVTLRLASGPPSGVDGSVEQMTYLIVIDTDGPEDMDYWVTAENRSSGNFAFTLTDWADSYTYDTDTGDYPGAGAIADDTILWRLPLDALGSPSRLRISIWAQLSVDFEPVAEDFVPDGGPDLSGDPVGWLVVLP